MKSWVRYSVAVYLGLLMAGSLVSSRQASAGSPALTRPRPAVHCLRPLPAPPTDTKPKNKNETKHEPDPASPPPAP